MNYQKHYKKYYNGQSKEGREGGYQFGKFEYSKLVILIGFLHLVFVSRPCMAMHGL